MIKIKKAVVTGAAGFIGRPLVKSLVEGGAEVIAVDRNPLTFDFCQTLTLDISDPGVLDGLVDEDTVIFHLAAKTSVQGSVVDPENDFKNTCFGMFQILETARKRKCRVIFPSTASIYDLGNNLPLSEDAFVKPSSPYGAAKTAGEAYCFVYHRCYGVDVRIARMFSVYGYGMTKFAIHDIIRNIQNNNNLLTLLGDGNQIRDYLFIEDIVDGLQTIACQGYAGEDYNLASGEGITILRLAQVISSLMGCPDINIKTTGKSFPGDVPRWYGDISKIKSIGFKQTVSLKNGLIKTIKWLEEN